MLQAGEGTGIARARRTLPALIGAWLLLGAAPSGAQPGAQPQLRQPELLRPRVSSDGVWRTLANDAAAATADVELDRGTLDVRLSVAPLEDSSAATLVPAELELPIPGGGFARFAVVESPILAPELAARYPEIRTYTLSGIDSDVARGRLATGPGGISAIFESDRGIVLIDPTEGRRDTYRSRLDSAASPGAFCSVSDEAAASSPLAGVDLAGSSPFVPARDRLLRDPAPLRLSSAVTNPWGDTLRTYELAVATTAEYYAARGNNDLTVLFSIVAIMTRVNMIYEAELAIRFVLIPEIDQLFSNDSTDFSNDNECTMRTENITFIDGILDDDDYDIGHVFGSGSGGCAGGSVVCVDGSKANGASNLNTGGDVLQEGFSGYRLVIHEMGHQFGASHIWSGLGGNCTAGQFAASSAYEPGGGTTAMSYSGTCMAANNIQTTTVDTYFNSHSFDQITAFITGGAGDDCPSAAATGNSAPDVDAGPDYTIPRDTPFVLDGSATDAEGDPLTYTWEQHDLAAGQFVPGVDPGVGPLFRSFPPDGESERTFPQISDLLNDTATLGELLPTMDRISDPLSFRLTARDNRAGGGGVDYDEMEVTVEGEPFEILSPNGGESLGAGCVEPVTWQVGGGDIASEVDLRLSSDGGSSFDPLLGPTANDGSESVDLPCEGAAAARVRANAVDNIFFDLSDGDFSIDQVAPEVTASATGGAVDDACTFEVTFEATVVDDCSVALADVSVDASVLTANASLSGLAFAPQQIDPTTVTLEGSVQVSDLQGGPAIVRVELTAVDGCGFETVETADADVIDDIPPEISAALDPVLLWPPNHRLVDVSAAVAATDNCPGVSFELTGVTSNEPENGEADGNTAPDIVGAELGTADLELQLRAERQGSGDGRVYTATWVATDGSGNEASDDAEVVVPKSRGSTGS